MHRDRAQRFVRVTVRYRRDVYDLLIREARDRGYVSTAEFVRALIAPTIRRIREGAPK